MTLITVPSGSRYHPFFEFTVDDGTATTECNLNSSGWTSCTSPHETGVLANENQVFEVRATDTVGNLGAVASHSWTQNAYATVALYHMDSADPYSDSSNNSLTLTPGNSPTSDTGQFGEGLVLSKISSQNLVSDSNSILDTIDKKFTVELWFNIASHPANNGLLPLIQVGDFNLTMRKKNGGTGVDYEINVGTSTTGRAAFNLGEWFHIAVIQDNGSTSVCVNGSSVAITSIASFNSTGVSSGIEIGGPVSSQYFDGAVDEVRVSQTPRYTGGCQQPTEPFSVD